MDDYDLKMEELDNQDSAGGDTELQAAGEVILAEDPLAEEACEEDSSSVDIGRCCREGELDIPLHVILPWCSAPLNQQRSGCLWTFPELAQERARAQKGFEGSLALLTRLHCED